MKEHGGLILNIASSYGFVPNFFAPIYAASKGKTLFITLRFAVLMKVHNFLFCPEVARYCSWSSDFVSKRHDESCAGGVIQFTRSLAHLGMNIRVNALCPDYVDTPLLHKAPQSVQDEVRNDVGYAALDKVVAGTVLYCTVPRLSGNMMLPLSHKLCRLNLPSFSSSTIVVHDLTWTMMCRCVRFVGRWKQGRRMPVGKGQRQTAGDLAYWGFQEALPDFREGWIIRLHWFLTDRA